MLAWVGGRLQRRRRARRALLGDVLAYGTDRPLDGVRLRRQRQVDRRLGEREPALRQADVLDRVGGGDGYAAGFFYGLLTGESPQEAVNLGWAHGALLTTFPGDITMATAEQVRAFAKGGSARIQR